QGRTRRATLRAGGKRRRRYYVLAFNYAVSGRDRRSEASEVVELAHELLGRARRRSQRYGHVRPRSRRSGNGGMRTQALDHHGLLGGEEHVSGVREHVPGTVVGGAGLG